MRILGMRVLGVLVPGRRVPARGPCRPYVPLLGAAAALLVVAAASPSAGQASQARVTAATAAKSVPAQPAPPVTFGPGGGAAGQSGAPSVAPQPRKLLSADVLVVSHDPLPSGVVAKVRGLRGVRAAEPVEAARVRVNGAVAAVLGVDPSAFRRFAARPTASRSALWQSVADGAIAVSYTMGRQAKLPAGSLVQVSGRQLETLRVGGLGTVGIAGVDAVVSRTVARSLGFPAGNAIVISTHRARLSALKSRIKAVVPRKAAVELLVAPAVHVKAGNPGTAGTPAATRGLLSPAQRTAFLRAAVSRVGMPYVWGAAGPTSFDCSGLVQWSLARAGVAMPRVAADQARTGPAVPVSRLQPGDLLFYHTDPTAPNYISHVAIYLGKGMMIQAPQPGMDVQIVPVALGSEFAGAVAVSPAVAAAAAANPLG
ncbi:MAG TPA: NlpC/P60 family protein [Streptosporangiaceae bacterium]|nr:NlpC/P60 family protein [Streptosporangiaceae bacterium]